MTRHSPVRIALLGAGIFARDAHIPALIELQDTFRIVAIYSRTRQNAEAAAALVPYGVEVTTDLEALFVRDDIDAFDVVLPIQSLAPVVEAALRTGRHVISEKPIAPDVETGLSLLAARRNQVWMVAENWRYNRSFLEARAAIERGDIGQPVLCHWALPVVMTPANKYYGTTWRRDGSFQGGFLLDGGVHYVAALRLLLGEIEQVAAFTRQVREDLPPVDTLAASLRFRSGALGTLGVTFAAGENVETAITITGDQGWLRVYRSTLEINRKGDTEQQTFQDRGVRDELAAFGAAILDGTPHRNSAEEALRDVAVIEAILRSARSGEALAPQAIPVS
ncbi:MAG: Gfo/Idh/MocA family oxidoreductase [Chloroflexota bacterium]|nr:MAG: hypothetical protein DIU68_12000 [Chloroflexota bacterium]